MRSTPAELAGDLLSTLELKAISHPVRRRIAGILSSGGPARAADLARDLDLPANQVSFHLRSLAAAGLIEEAPEHARDRRDRVWKAARKNLRIADPRLANDPSHRAAIGTFMAAEARAVTASMERIIAWLDEHSAGRSEEPKGEWLTSTLRLSQGEAEVLLRSISAAVNQAKETSEANRADGQPRHLWDLTVLAARDDLGVSASAPEQPLP